ncbi:hypothetical protein BDY21DRAFT_56011 [Lineolata rhizophorae]|uniref:Uncharacterized protein n=1 Tax=Lineolata rhizophorae TaxID=578093 RepID=A0A6A6NWI2_9PEZI|nr:hypothetical protein BDY21DRAFT_56011 [Lineolata rhizophorae]
MAATARPGDGEHRFNVPEAVSRHHGGGFTPLPGTRPSANFNCTSHQAHPPATMVPAIDLPSARNFWGLGSQGPGFGPSAPVAQGQLHGATDNFTPLDYNAPLGHQPTLGTEWNSMLAPALLHTSPVSEMASGLDHSFQDQHDLGAWESAQSFAHSLPPFSSSMTGQACSSGSSGHAVQVPHFGLAVDGAADRSQLAPNSLTAMTAFDSTLAHSPYGRPGGTNVDSRPGSAVSTLKDQALPSDASCPPKKLKRGRASENMIIEKSGHGSVVIFRVDGTGKLKRQRLNEDRRQKVRMVRAITACDKCKKSKCGCLRGSLYEYWVHCSKTVVELPSWVENITGLKFFREGPAAGHPLASSGVVNNRLLNVNAEPTQALTVRLTQSMGAELDVYVSKFQPEGDEAHHRWRIGDVQHIVQMPPYCITRESEVKKKVEEYFRKSVRQYWSSALDGADEVTSKVFQEAVRFMKQRVPSGSILTPPSVSDSRGSRNKDTVRLALRTFTAARMIEHDWSICGEETLGIDKIEDPNNPWNGKIPVTATMDTQLDQIVIWEFLVPLREELLAALNEKFEIPNEKDWYEVFLTVFILLANAERLLAHSRRNAVRYGATNRYNSISLAQSYFLCCFTLLTRFHHAYKQTTPLNCLDRLPPEFFDDNQTNFLKDLSQIFVKEKVDEIRKLHSERRFENDLYWTHQLFFTNWKRANETI